MKSKIPINSEIKLDQIKYCLQIQLSTEELVDFALSLGDKYYDEENFYKILSKKFNKFIFTDNDFKVK